jgi:transposase
MPCIQENKEILSHIKITCLERPGNSPDLNPVANLWALCKDRFRKVDCITEEKTISAVIKVWFHEPKIKETFKKLVDSMSERVKLIIKARGGHIK